MELSLERPPLALIACSDDWMSRALESVFQQHGYVVAHTRSGSQTLELARLSNHDLLVLDESLEDLRAVDVCRTIRQGGQFDHSVPIVITAPTPVDPRARMAAFAAGAWEYCSHPLDLEPVFVKLETFIRARGTLWKESAAGFADVAHVFREQSRQSDVVGHVGDLRLAILAPDTDAAGARLLVARLQRELDRASQTKSIGGKVRLRAGYSAVSDLAESQVNVAELVHRAESALDHAPIQGDGDAIVSFDDLPVF